MEQDYSITWSYIVSRMASRYGFGPDNSERMAFGTLQRYLEDIWTEFFEEKLKEEKNNG